MSKTVEAGARACASLTGAFVVGDSIIVATKGTPAATPAFFRRPLPPDVRGEDVVALDPLAQSFITGGTLYGWTKGRYKAMFNVHELATNAE